MSLRCALKIMAEPAMQGYRPAFAGLKMTDVTYGRLLGVIGGLLGVLALFLPWFVASATDFTNTVVRLSGFDAILSLIQDMMAGEPLLGGDASLQVLGVAVLVGIGGWGVFIAGSAISVFRPQGGIVMFVGIVVTAAATSVMATEVAGLETLAPVLLEIDLGIFVAFTASIVAVAGIFLRKREIGG